ncbi:NADH-quinone oxidoreductase subunit J [Aestuariimicrobium sp. Y1814]|uniref:NADH-quinone oxidoreductase subunit J n=1 Tax=Aestuariimicrobium sp. Y1814 TaxID=3418742 RepID=UPI003DA76CB0
MLLPLVSGQAVAFWIVAPIMVICALGMVMSRKAVHSAIWLVGMMIGLAVLYASLASPFLFVAQIIVYTGAIMMLFLFVVMLIGVDTSDSVIETIKGHRIAATFAAIGFGLLLVSLAGRAVNTPPQGLDAVISRFPSSVHALSDLLFGRYVVVFEATAALLTIAAVGAMVLAHGERLIPKLGQKETADKKMAAYAKDGTHPGPMPNSGVYARFNAIHAPALLPDGSVAETSVSKILSERGAYVDANELRAPSEATFNAISTDNSPNNREELE